MTEGSNSANSQKVIILPLCPSRIFSTKFERDGWVTFVCSYCKKPILETADGVDFKNITSHSKECPFEKIVVKPKNINKKLLEELNVVKCAVFIDYDNFPTINKQSDSCQFKYFPSEQGANGTYYSNNEEKDYLLCCECNEKIYKYRPYSTSDKTQLNHKKIDKNLLIKVGNHKENCQIGKYKIEFDTPIKKPKEFYYIFVLPFLINKYSRKILGNFAEIFRPMVFDFDATMTSSLLLKSIRNVLNDYSVVLDNNKKDFIANFSEERGSRELSQKEYKILKDHVNELYIKIQPLFQMLTTQIIKSKFLVSKTNGLEELGMLDVEQLKNLPKVEYDGVNSLFRNDSKFKEPFHSFNSAESGLLNSLDISHETIYNFFDISMFKNQAKNRLQQSPVIHKYSENDGLQMKIKEEEIEKAIEEMERMDKSKESLRGKSFLDRSETHQISDISQGAIKNNSQPQSASQGFNKDIEYEHELTDKEKPTAASIQKDDRITCSTQSQENLTLLGQKRAKDAETVSQKSGITLKSKEDLDKTHDLSSTQFYKKQKQNSGLENKIISTGTSEKEEEGKLKEITEENMSNEGEEEIKKEQEEIEEEEGSSVAEEQLDGDEIMNEKNVAHYGYSVSQSVEEESENQSVQSQSPNEADTTSPNTNTSTSKKQKKKEKANENLVLVQNYGDNNSQFFPTKCENEEEVLEIILKEPSKGETKNFGLGINGARYISKDLFQILSTVVFNSKVRGEEILKKVLKNYEINHLIFERKLSTNMREYIEQLKYKKKYPGINEIEVFVNIFKCIIITYFKNDLENKTRTFIQKKDNFGNNIKEELPIYFLFIEKTGDEYRYYGYNKKEQYLTPEDEW